MADLATAKKGEIVIMKGGKRIESDGRGGGRVSRPGKKQPPKKKVKPSGKPTKNKPQPKTQPKRETTVERGLRAAGSQGATVTDLIKQGKGR